MTTPAETRGSLPEQNEEEVREMNSRFGWKWAVLASTMGTLYQRGELPSNNLVQKLRLSRNKLESGCYSLCETACDLRDIETEMFPLLTKLGPQETDGFLELSSKAVSGRITAEDLNLTGLQPIASDCTSLPCVCQK
ncbi:MAG: hypothetical protein ACFFE8_12995 [Candidatus Heimdallarchaeota archaeon]